MGSEQISNIGPNLILDLAGFDYKQFMNQGIAENCRAFNQKLGEPNTWVVIPNETHVLTEIRGRDSQREPC